MQDDDSFIYHISNGQMGHVHSAESSLITAERSQKLDLLIHLIANLKKTLVLCGAKGIGKTTLLNELKQRKKDKWLMMSMTASADLSFESFQQQLSQYLKQQYTEYVKLDLSLILPQLDKRNKKVVVIIDDASLLVAGLLSTIIQYAAVTTCLRIVCALTDDEVKIKNATDRAIENSHFIEIPALTESQCGVYLHKLSSQPVPLIHFNQINGYLVEKVYHLSHGIPGKIVSELPRLVNGSFGGSHKWFSITLISILVALTVSYLSNDIEELKLDLDTNQEAELLKEKEKTNLSVVEISLPELTIDKDVNSSSVEEVVSDVNVPLIQDNELKNVDKISSQSLQQKRQIMDDLAITVENKILELKPKEDVLDIKKKPVIEAIDESLIVQEKTKTVNIVKQEKVTLKKVETIEQKKDIAKKDDSEWGLKQAQKNYTIQLMVLSTQQALISFLNKNQKIQKDIKFFQISQNGQEKYILVYGSFESTEIALDKMQLLPIEFRKSWVRPFRDLQKELKR